MAGVWATGIVDKVQLLRDSIKNKDCEKNK